MKQGVLAAVIAGSPGTGSPASIPKPQLEAPPKYGGARGWQDKGPVGFGGY